MISSIHADSDELTAHFTGREWVFHKIDQWLYSDDNPSFLLLGGPGTGKSTMAARLVEMADRTVEPTIEGLGDALIYHHFCHARDPLSLEPRRFIEGLSLALCSRHEVCAKVTAEQAADVEINVLVENVSADSVRGVVINRLFVSEGLDLNVAFDRIVRRPVEALRESGVQTPLLVLIDSLDEAISLGGEQHIPWMIERVMSGADGSRPEGMRLFVTSRRQTAAIRHVGDAKRCDLILDAPDDVDDLRAYVARRLIAIPDARRQQLATEISKAGKGNFLYARYLIDDPVRDWSEVEDVGALGLPDGLPGIYEEFLTRRLAATAEAWRLYRPLLGLLAVAQGDGLPPSHLRGAHRRAVPDLRDSLHDDALSDLDQYLAPRWDPKAPYRIYHRSFEEYLLPDDEQEQPYRVYPKEAHADIARQLIESRDDRFTERWDECDLYGQQFMALHLTGAGMWEALGHLLDDPLYLITAEPTQLLAALDIGRNELSRRSANLYRGIVHLLRDQPIGVAAAYLDLAARQFGADALREHEAFGALERPWSVRWLRWERENSSRVLTRHAGGFIRLALGSFEDRTVVVSTARDLQVTYVDDGSPAREPIVSPHDWIVSGVAVTRLEGELTIFTAGNEGIKRWGMDSDKGELLPGCDGRVNDIVLWETSDSVFLIGGCKDGTVRMWDLNLDTPPVVVGAHGEFKYQLGSKDGPVMGGSDVRCVTVGDLSGEPVLATGGQDKTIRLWKLPELSAIGEPLTGHVSWIEALRFAEVERGTLLLSGGAMEDSPRIWGPAEGVEVGTYSPEPQGFSGNSAIYDLDVGEVDGRPCAITCSYDGGIRLWDLPHGGPIGGPLIGHDGPIKSLAIDRSSRWHALVSGGDDETVRCWDLDESALAAHGGERRSCNAVSIAVGHYEGRSVLCCADSDWELRILDAATGEPVVGPVGNPVQIHPSAAVGATHAPFAFGIVEGRPAVAAYFDERLGFFEPATAEQFGVPRPMKPSEGYINEIRFARLAEGAVVVASSTEGGIWVESIRGERSAGLVAPKFSAVTAATLHGHDYVASGGYGPGNPVTLQKLADGSVAATFGTGHSGHVSALAGGTLTGASVVATGGSDGEVRLWTARGELLHKISFGARIDGLDFSGEVDLVISTKKGIVVLRMAT